MFNIAYYTKIINSLKENNYKFTSYNYSNKDENEKKVILRHDVDMCLEYALDNAKLDYSLNIKSTFFILLSSDFYNIFSEKNREIIKQIIDLGHQVGLHFDESIYKWKNYKELEKYISYEKKIFEKLTMKKCDVISFHRPIKELYNKKLESNIISTYEEEFLKNYKYISDSRRTWKVKPLEVIKSGEYKNIQLLTHPIWYKEKDETACEIINRLKSLKEEEIYNNLKKNITNFESFIK